MSHVDAYCLNRESASNSLDHAVTNQVRRWCRQSCDLCVGKTTTTEATTRRTTPDTTTTAKPSTPVTTKPPITTTAEPATSPAATVNHSAVTALAVAEDPTEQTETWSLVLLFVVAILIVAGCGVVVAFVIARNKQKEREQMQTTERLSITNILFLAL